MLKFTRIGAYDLWRLSCGKTPPPDERIEEMFNDVYPDGEIRIGERTEDSVVLGLPLDMDAVQRTDFEDHLRQEIAHPKTKLVRARVA